MIQAIFIDIDGTLLKPDHTISHKNQEAIKAIKRYIPVFLATGRSARDTRFYHKTLLLDTPAICMNGTYIIDLINNQILKEERIPLSLVIDLKEALESLPLSAIYYSQDRWITQKITPAIEREIFSVGFLIEVIPFFESIIKNWPGSHNGPNKVGLLSNDEKQLLESYDWLKEKFKDRLNIQRSQLNFIEVIPLGVSKKTGIEYILKNYSKKYPFSKENVMAIGDSDNDIEMLRWAGISVAMGNAAEHIKEVAEITTMSNQEDGLAYIINQSLNNYSYENKHPL